MRPINAVCVMGLVLACGGKVDHDALGSVPVGVGGGNDGGAGRSDVVEAADAGSAPAVPVEKGACRPGDPPDALSGSIAGVPTMLNLSGNGFSTGVPAQARWTAFRAASPDEALLAWGAGGPDGGRQRSAGALIVVPKPESGPTFYCAASVTATSTPVDVGHASSIALSELSRLGECPGAAVDGKVDVCLDGSDAKAGCAETLGVKATIDGREVRLKNLSGSIDATSIGGAFQGVVTGADGSGAVILFANAPDGKLTGWLRLPDDAPSNAGLVLCLSNAFVVGQTDGGYSITFQSLGRLGPCPGTPVDGALGYCDRFD